MNRLGSTLQAFLIALLAIAFVLLLRQFFVVPILGITAPILTFLVAVVVAAWAGGVKGGLFAIVLGLATGTFLRGLTIPSIDSQLRMIAFVFFGGAISWGIGSLSAYQQRIKDRQRELEQEVCRRTEVEAALREREERIRLAVESAEIGTWDFNPLTGKAISSARCNAAFGFPPKAEASLADYIERIHPDDRELMQQAMQSALDPIGSGAYDIDYRTVCPDGTTRWLIAKGQAFFDGEMPSRRAVRFIGTVLDVTERKQTEETLRQAKDALQAEQELLRRTIEAQDQERQLVAYEIHDGLVQYATGALMQLEGIHNQLESAVLAEQIENVVGILRKTVEEGRRIIGGIHATVLDDWGVAAAVEELIKDEERAHVQVEFVREESLGRMAGKIEQSLYRITQEALTNVYKHSQSNKVRIELSRRDDRVHLEVRDWGVGFTLTTAPDKTHGLRGMTERARIAGGQCKIESSPGNGTKVVADLPHISRN